MIHLEDGNLLVQTAKDLPWLTGFRELFLDVETCSGDKKRGGDEWMKDDRICGVSITVDDNPISWHIPVRYTDKSWNIPIFEFQKWLKFILDQPCDWINSNVIFDAHFCCADGAEFSNQTRLIDTVTMCKMIDSDRMHYGLKIIAKDWLGLERPDQDRAEAWRAEAKTKDHADTPADIEGNYGCRDVIDNRKVWRYCQQHYEESAKLAWNNEILLTPVLYDMEKFGMPIDVKEVMIQKALSLQLQNVLGSEIAETVGHEVNPASHVQIFDTLITQFGLPVLSRNEDEGSNSFGNPSFDGDAFEKYMIHPSVLADKRIRKCVAAIKEARDESHFCGLFLTSYLDLHANGVLHPSYNQTVRTGRMSCRKPNAQQLNSRAKRLIHPYPGMGIISCDYSQIEFRLIAHYINDIEAIKSYNEDPTTDFHQWVADMCGVKRKAAKCLNFGMGFGAGKSKVVKMLMGDPSVIETVSLEINAEITSGKLDPANRVKEFDMRCYNLAIYLFNTYHERLPGIKLTSKRCSNVAGARGYVFNAHGRRCHLPKRFCYKAFNRVVQSEAADIMKERTIALAPRYNSKSREIGLNIFAIVHDDESTMVPLDAVHDPKVHHHIKSTLENVDLKYCIPIVTDMGFALNNWADASAEKPVMQDGKCVGGPIEL